MYKRCRAGCPSFVAAGRPLLLTQARAGAWATRQETRKRYHRHPTDNSTYMSHTILVTGATGTVGSEVIKALTNRGVTVRAGVHSIIKGERLKQLNPDVQLVEVDYARPATLHVALTGVDRVFMLTPPSADQVALGKQIIDAARQVNVHQVVKLSVSQAADEPLIRLGQWHREVEEYLAASGLPYVLLRPCSFMQNFIKQSQQSICDEGVISLPLGEGRVSYIDVRDIALVAAAVLTAAVGQHQGQAYTLTGQTPLTVAEVAAAISQAADRPVRFVDVTEEAARQAMPQAHPTVVEAMLELHRVNKAGRSVAPTSLVEQLTGCPPRTIEQFAHDNRQCFQPATA